MKPNDNNSLAHTTWNCKYYIVLAKKPTGIHKGYFLIFRIIFLQ